MEAPGTANSEKKGNAFFQDLSVSQSHLKPHSTAFYLVITAVLLFVLEFWIMFMLQVLPPLPPFAEAALDSFMLLVASFPLLYLLIIKPLNFHITEHKRDKERLIQLKKAIGSMTIGVTVTDMEGRIVYCNPAEAKMHGYSVEELQGSEARILSPPSRWKKAAQSDMQNFKHWRRERVNIRKDGTAFPVQLTSTIVTGDDGEPIGLITNCEDISERKHFENALIESEERYRSLVESTDDSIYVVDRDCKYVYMNRKHQGRITGEGYKVVGKAYGEFHSARETELFVEKIGEVIKNGESVQHEQRSSRDGKYFLRTMSPIWNADGEIETITVVSKDITKLKDMENELRVLSLTDELTGLYNRRGLITLGAQQLKVAERMKGEIFILYVDLDYLKSVNDTYGHSAGDALLVETANALRDTLRNADIVARVGGDEFVCLILGSHEEANAIAQRIQESVDSFNAGQDHEYKLSLTIGISHYDPDSPKSLDTLILEADRAMLDLKKERSGGI